MYVVRIVHPVRDFDNWRKAFDSDPIGRKKIGVRRYHVLRSTDETNEVMVDLELDSLEQAENVLVTLQSLWKRIPGDLVMSPQARILEMVESKEV